jgi:hypothetical protein
MQKWFQDVADEKVWKYVFAVTRPALLVTPKSFLTDIRAGVAAAGVHPDGSRQGFPEIENLAAWLHCHTH